MSTIFGTVIGVLPRGWDVKGVLVVSLMDVNYRLWSHFKGVWDGKWLYFAIQVSLKAVHKEIYKNEMALATRSFNA